MSDLPPPEGFPSEPPSQIPPPPPPPPGGQPPPPPPGSASSFPPPPRPGGTDPGYSTALPPSQRNYASFGKRLGAVLLDGLIVGVPAMIIVFVLLGTLPTERGICEDFDGDLYACEPLTDGGVAVLLLVGGLLALAYVGYMVFLEGTRGATLGKQALGIRVVDVDDGSVIGAGRAFLRLIIRYPSSWVCYLGYLWMLWDDRSQTWHDKASRAVVIDA